MSLQGLRNFNAAYGFLPLHRKTNFGETTGKRENLFVKLVASIPVLGVVFAHNRKDIMDINLTSRVVLSTACLFPLVFALDVLATLYSVSKVLLDIFNSKPRG